MLTSIQKRILRLCYHKQRSYSWLMEKLHRDELSLAADLEESFLKYLNCEVGEDNFKSNRYLTNVYGKTIIDNERKDGRRYWITTAIAIAALLLALVSILWQAYTWK